jgi:protocatechuate 3,4-dioxygenase beta subunit
MESIQPGSYRLTGDRVGFLRQGYGSRTPGGTAAPLNLAESQSLKDVEVRMTPQGVILGTVLDDEGDPAPRAMLTATQLGSSSSSAGRGGAGRGGAGGPGGQSGGGSATSNDIGEFRIAGLSPGRYTVVATSQGRGGGPGGRGGGMPAQPVNTQEDESLLPTYYPSTLDASAAAPVEVTPGQEVGGVNINLRKGSLYKIQGKVAGASAQDLANLNVMLMRRGNAGMGGMGRSGNGLGADGSFEITRVQPGSYYLIAQRMARQQQGSSLMGRATVDISSSDVTGVVVPVAEPITVTGTVKVEGTPTASNTRLTVSLSSVERLPVGSPSGRMTDATNFTLSSVAPDTYYITFGGIPSGTYVKSVRLNNQEVLEKGIDLTNTRTTANLDVLLSPKAATLSGIVTDKDQPLAGSYVVILADPPREAQLYLNKSTTTDQNGKFSFSGLAPGDYKLYAWEESRQGTTQNPDLAAPFAQKAVKVSLKESGADTVELPVLKAEDARN